MKNDILSFLILYVIPSVIVGIMFGFFMGYRQGCPSCAEILEFARSECELRSIIKEPTGVLPPDWSTNWGLENTSH